MKVSVKIIGTLILSLHIDRDDLHTIIEEFTEKLMDNDFRVKLRVIKTLKKILNQDYKKISQGDTLTIEVKNLTEKLILENNNTNEKIQVTLRLTEREKTMIKMGGKLAAIRAKQAKA